MDLRPTSNAAAAFKDLQPSRAEQWRAAGRVAPQSQSAMAMLLRRALPATHHYSAHPFLFMRWVLGPL